MQARLSTYTPEVGKLKEKGGQRMIVIMKSLHPNQR